MIHTSRQLKALVRNRSGGNSAKAQTIIRNYIMERLLERISLSKYKDRFILKGGMLISALVGLENRATMDDEATIIMVDSNLQREEILPSETCGATEYL